MLSTSNYYVHCDWTAHAVICRIVSNLPFLAYGRTYFTMICLKRKKKKCVGLVLFRSHTFFKKKMWSRASTVSRLQAVKKKGKKEKKTKTNKNKKYIFRLDSQHAFEKK